MAPPSAPLRIPVISWKPGLSDDLVARIRAGSADASPSRALLDSGALEFVTIPVPVYPSAEQQAQGVATASWELTKEQEELLERAEIIVGDAHNCAKVLLERETTLPSDKQSLLSNVKWVQGTYAGVERYLNLLTPETPIPSFTLTRAGGVDGMTQYVLGWIVAIERQLHLASEFQAKGVYAQDKLRYRSFRSLTVGVLGLGAIGQAIGKLVKLAGFRVVGFKRRVNDEDRAALAECTDDVTSDLDDILQRSDYIVSILPSTAATKYLLTEERLQQCQERKPVLINVGRGDLISEATIVKALDSDWLSLVVLDVFEHEPLDASSALWQHPKVRLTPHVAAYCFGEDVADTFVPNLDTFLRGDAVESMAMRVDWSAGY